MKILVVCGNGLGSSLMMEMNVKKALQQLNIAAEVSHTDLATAKTEKADYYIGSPEIMEQLQNGSRKTISVVNIFSQPEIQQALQNGLEG